MLRRSLMINFEDKCPNFTSNIVKAMHCTLVSQLLNTAVHTHSGTGPRTATEDPCPYLAQHKKLHFHMRRIDEQSVDEV